MSKQEDTEWPDAWKQFYKNISGVGFSAFIILSGSCLSNEYSKGTFVLIATKGLSRKSVILAKYTAAAVLMTDSYWVGYATVYDHIFPLDSRFSVFEYSDNRVRYIQSDFHKYPLYGQHCCPYISARNGWTDCKIQFVYPNLKKYRFDFWRSRLGRIYDTCFHFRRFIRFGIAVLPTSLSGQARHLMPVLLPRTIWHLPPPYFPAGVHAYGFPESEQSKASCKASIICHPCQAPLPIIHRVSYRWKIPVSCDFVALQDVFRSASYHTVLRI